MARATAAAGPKVAKAVEAAGPQVEKAAAGAGKLLGTLAQRARETAKAFSEGSWQPTGGTQRQTDARNTATDAAATSPARARSPDRRRPSTGK